MIDRAKSEAAEAFAFIAEHTSDVIARVRADGALSYISPSVRRYGYEPEALLGRRPEDIVHPDDAERLLANNAELLRGEFDPTVVREHRFRTADGAWVWMQGNPQLVIGADGEVVEIVNVFRDVTRRRALEAEAVAQAELFEAAFNQAAIGMALIALDGTFLRLNEAFCRIVGYSHERMLELDFQTITHPDDLDADLGLLRQLASGEIGSYRLDKRYRRADGQLVWVHLSVSMVRDEHGAPKHFVSQVQDLTERRAAEAALRESEARFRLIAENTSDIIVMSDLAGRATYISPSIRRMGYEPDDLIGQSFAPRSHPEDFPAVERVFRNVFAGGPPQQVRWRARNAATDEWTWLESSPTLVRDRETGAPVGFLDVARDVTVQVEQAVTLAATRAEADAAAAALKHSEARYRMIAENTSDLIAMSDTEGRITYASPSFRQLGLDPGALMGKPFSPHVHPEDEPRIVGLLRSQTPGGPIQHLRWRARHATRGDWVWLESAPARLWDPVTGEPCGFLDVARDVTLQVAQEEAVALARAEAEAAATAKSQFLANMSHEIRTPLTAVLGFTNLLREVELPEAAASYVQRIAGAGNALLAIVNDILDFSKLEAGKFEVRPRPTRLADVCEETLNLFSIQAEAKGLSLSFEAAEGLPRAAMIDGDRLRQLMINLIGNAVKFTDQGGVTLRVAPTGAGAVALEVTDTGPGLDPEAQAALFQRFTQIDGSMTRRHGGTGLGLAISRGIAEAMGGAIGVTSTPGQGATFRVELPAPAADLPIELDGEATTISIDGIRVLIVDDNPVNRELSRRILEAAGAEVTDAPDGAQGLEQLAMLPVDVVLMDLRMPVLDGRAALKALRATPGPNQQTPVLAFTADADLEGEGDLDGFDGLVRKPIQPLDMYEAIAGVVQWSLEADDGDCHVTG